MVQDWKKFFGICLNAPDPETRTFEVMTYLKKKVAEPNLIETICGFIEGGPVTAPWVIILSLFNFSDLIKSKQELNESDKKLWEIYKAGDRFFLGVAPNGVVELALFKTPICNAVSLSNYFIENFLLIYPGEDGQLKIMLNVIGKIGFNAFAFRPFLEKVIEYNEDPTKRDIILEIIDALSDPLLNRGQTQKRYWLYYVLVEKLKGEYGLRGAFREVGKRLSEKAGTIETRYWGRKKIAKERGLSIDNVIRQYYLWKALKQYL